LENWQVSLVLRHFHLSLCERIIDEQASASSSSSTPSPPGGIPRSSRRNLTVADMRAAEQQAPPVAPPDPAQPHSQAFRQQKQTAALSMQSWLKEHAHLQAVPVEQGEPSVALLLLWEADHQHPYPCGKADLTASLNYFSKRLVDAVAVDTELSGWLHHRKTRMVLSSGLRPTSNTLWAVRILPEAGTSFLQAWKAHLRTLVHQQQHRPLPSTANASARPSPRGSPAPTRTRKRARSGAPPPLHTKQARVDRLRAAHAALEVHRGAPGSSSASSSSSSAPQASVEARDFAGEAAGPLTLPRGLT
jgi:hypothetical protein